MRELIQRAQGSDRGRKRGVEMLYDSLLDDLLGAKIAILGRMFGEKFNTLIDFQRLVNGRYL